MMRLDLLLTEKGYYSSRSKAAQAIKRGSVAVNGETASKPSAETDESAAITIKSEKSFVSMGGYKLDKAFDDFALDVSGETFADLGASTGGFTDVLLQRGAKKVYCVDVGEGLLDPKIAGDKRVVDMSRVNARLLTAKDFSETIDGAVIDCSFISLKLILPAAKSIIKEGGKIVALVKPQFECGADKLGKSGILLGAPRQRAVISDIFDYCAAAGLCVMDFTHAPIKKKKNIEYLLLLSTAGESLIKTEVLKRVDFACSAEGEK